MVDVAEKPVTLRTAVAAGRVLVNEETFALLKSGGTKKGDVLAVAQVAGIMGAKRTSDLIPMCHPVATDGTDLELTLDPEYQRKLDGNYETGINLGKLTRNEMRALRRDMQMIFQDPAASLDPRQTVGKSIEEVFVINTDLSPEVRKERVMTLLE